MPFMQTIHELTRAPFTAQDLLQTIAGHAQRGDAGDWYDVPGWNPNFAHAMSRLTACQQAATTQAAMKKKALRVGGEAALALAGRLPC